MARSVADPAAPAPEAQDGSAPAKAVPPAERPPFRRRRGVAPLGLFALLLAVCAPLVALNESKNQPIFVLDEFAYADYLHKVHDGQLYVRTGEITGQETLRELACRGYNLDTIFPVRPPCDAPSFDPAGFPNNGIDSADVHPPTYFIVTDLGARVIMALGVTDNLIRAGRLFGAVWMAAGFLALWYLMRAFGANRGAAILALALVAASPSLLVTWYYLTPDSANILVGALVVLAALRWERTGRGLPMLAGAGALALAFKAPNLIVVVAVAGYLVVRGLLARRAAAADAAPPADAPPPPDGAAVPDDGPGLLARRVAPPDHAAAQPEDAVAAVDAPVDAPVEAAAGAPAPRRYLVAAACVSAGALVVAGGWLVVRMALAMPDATSPMEERFAVDGIGVSEITDNLGGFISVWDQGSRAYPWARIASYLLAGSLLAALVKFDHRDRRHTLAAVTGVMLLVGPILLVVSNVITTGTYFVVQPRYGATLVPLECALAACLWRGRAALVAVATLVVSYLTVVLILFLRL